MAGFGVQVIGFTVIGLYEVLGLLVVGSAMPAILRKGSDVNIVKNPDGLVPQSRPYQRPHIRSLLRIS